jgi:hypothetical protein
MAVSRACVHVWSYRLAKGSEGAEIVARAVVEACRDAIHREASLDEGARNQFYKGNFVEQIVATEKLYFENALFRVVQARAGRCEIK